MTNPIRRTKNFVRKHDRKIAATAGLIVGVAGMYQFGPRPHEHFLIQLSPDQVQELLKDATLGLRFESAHATIDAIVTP